MDYPGDYPPSPEERAGLRLAANAEWLAGAKQRGHAPDGPYFKYPDWEALDEKAIERDNQKVVAAARKAIDSERNAHKCYICGRQDLPRWGRWFGLWGVGLVGLRLYFPDSPETVMFGYLGAAALGAALGASLHEVTKPEGAEESRKKFNKTLNS